MKFPAVFLLLLLFTALCVSAQSDSAEVVVQCQDPQGNRLTGERIWFQSEKTGEYTKGVTGTGGRFTTKLKGNETYDVVIKSLTGITDYTELKIPPLEPNEAYGTYKIFIQIEPPREFTLDHVYFETAKASLKPESHKELNELYDFLKYKSDVIIAIGGHTDSIGTETDNLALSLARAESVKQYLVKKGIDDERMRCKGYGESRPVADNRTEPGRQKNRRTQIKILDERFK